MKVFVTGVCPEALKQMCAELGLKVENDYSTSRDDGESCVILHNICGCCTPAINFKGDFPIHMDTRDSYLFVTDRAESIERYPGVLRITSKDQLLAELRQVTRDMA